MHQRHIVIQPYSSHFSVSDPAAASRDAGMHLVFTTGRPAARQGARHRPRSPALFDASGLGRVAGSATCPAAGTIHQMNVARNEKALRRHARTARSIFGDVS
jgi:hypothetical protein